MLSFFVKRRHDLRFQLHIIQPALAQRLDQQGQDRRSTLSRIDVAFAQIADQEPFPAKDIQRQKTEVVVKAVKVLRWALNRRFGAGSIIGVEPGDRGKLARNHQLSDALGQANPHIIASRVGRNWCNHTGCRR